jgi:hypothetical protein
MFTEAQQIFHEVFVTDRTFYMEIGKNSFKFIFDLLFMHVLSFFSFDDQNMEVQY